MKFIVSIFFLLITVLANCQTQDQPLHPIVSADSLLSTSLDSEWSSAKFEQIYINLFIRLDHSNTGVITIDNSKRTFAKLFNIKNYRFLESKDYTLNERFSMYDTFDILTSRAFATYAQKSKIINGRFSYEREVTGFIVLLFEMMKDQAVLGDELRKTMHTLTQKQIDGFGKMKKDLAGMMEAVLSTIEREYTYFSEASVSKLSSAFISFYSAMNKRIEPDAKTEFDKRIANMIKTHPLPFVRAALQAG